ncbi:MAG: outer membrane beta-barrel protein [Thermodesulfobacteriota bacterium]
MQYKRNLTGFFLTVFCIFFLSQYLYAGNDTISTGQSKQGIQKEEKGIGAEVFGKKAGNYHPFLLFEELYTDNMFATKSNKQSSFITTIAPGIWIAFPANRTKMLSIDTTTTAPGGLQLSRIKPETARRYQAYALYSPEFVFYSDSSGDDHTNHRAEGFFQYNFDSGLSFDLIDLFNSKEEIAGNGITNTFYKHEDNLFDFITTYVTPSDKLKLQLQYSNYNLDYKEDEVLYRDRQDNSIGVSVFYKFWPKTSLFAEYEYSDIDFDSSSTFDSVENRYYGGINWDVTAKTRGTLKLGYIDKDFDLSSENNQDAFSMEVQTRHNFTQKRELRLNVHRRFNESDMEAASSFLSTGITLSLVQRFTEKWSGTLNALYENNDYNGVDREDDLYGIGPALSFEAKNWLKFNLGYFYYKNDSDIDYYSYDQNNFFFRTAIQF